MDSDNRDNLLNQDPQAQQFGDVAESEASAEAEPMTEEKLSEQRQIRREKLTELREAGRDPFLQETWDVTAHSVDIKENFDAMEDQEVSMAGRIMTKRIMGKAAFFDLQDKQGRIQCYVKRDEIGEDEYKWFKTDDIGDIVVYIYSLFSM